MNILSALFVKNTKKIGKHHDGAGLYLVVRENGSRSWLLRRQLDGKRKEIGLGSAQVNGLSLSKAREKATLFREYIADGLDPVKEIKRLKDEEDAIITFEAATKIVFNENIETWASGKHQKQWLTTLEKHAYPVIGKMQISEIQGPDIINVLKPIWLKTPETARRVKQRIGVVLDWAHAKGFRDTEAPLRSVGRGLPKQPKNTKHFPAMPYEDVPGFMIAVNETQTMGKFALQFAILCAARSGEVRGSRWSEIDLEKKVWTIPEERMKAKVEHVVPLTEACLEILHEVMKVRRGKEDDLLFPSIYGINKSLSDMTLTKALRDMSINNATVHGFRSSFRDWAAEKTDYVGDIVEAALAHTLKNKVEAAYKRTNYLEKRKPLMQDWADYILSKPKIAQAA